MPNQSTKATKEKESGSKEVAAHGSTMTLSQASANYYAPKGSTIRVVAPVGCSVEVISPEGCDISVSNAKNCDVVVALGDHISTRLVGVKDSDIETVGCTDVHNV